MSAFSNFILLLASTLAQGKPCSEKVISARERSIWFHARTPGGESILDGKACNLHFQGNCDRRLRVFSGRLGNKGVVFEVRRTS